MQVNSLYIINSGIIVLRHCYLKHLITSYPIVISNTSLQVIDWTLHLNKIYRDQQLILWPDNPYATKLESPFSQITCANDANSISVPGCI